MPANNMGGPKVTLARIRERRRLRLQQKALALGAPGVTTARSDSLSLVRPSGEDENDDIQPAAFDTPRRSHSLDKPGESSTAHVDCKILLPAQDPSLDRGEPAHDEASDHELDTARDSLHQLENKRKRLLEHDDWLNVEEMRRVLKKASRSKERGAEERHRAAAVKEDASRLQARGEAGLTNSQHPQSHEQQHIQVSKPLVSRSKPIDDTGGGHVGSQPVELKAVANHLASSEPAVSQAEPKRLPDLTEPLFDTSIKGLFTGGGLGRRSAEEVKKVTQEHAVDPASEPQRRQVAEINQYEQAVDWDERSRSAEEVLPSMKSRPDEGSEEKNTEAEAERQELESLGLETRESMRRQLFG
ncbi:hypothetical protein BDZ90DRAFT_257521 [Jaminaea rosea]|uniref:Uncharacterized protein n=1 Tax=Jaminaea rosea TaxID=1569628 RepID=A0A316UYS0_9BASI|nr:hypothetical protein BDZ90DRAFT_257521 [Jaminaea rosea]PWN30440.1 hypothetical protein BDZ90DRAFT_257521 [Jaminaea rosea]